MQKTYFQTDRPVNGQADKHTGICADRQAERQTNRQKMQTSGRQANSKTCGLGKTVRKADIDKQTVIYDASLTGKQVNQ